MSAIETLVALIKKSEGCRLEAYFDATGNCWTIGWGCCGVGITEGTEWTQRLADNELYIRAEKALASALKASPILVKESKDKQAAIADLIYNMGLYGYVGHSLKPYVDKGEWVNAASEILLFCNSGGKPLQGLKNRRMAEAKLLLS